MERIVNLLQLNRSLSHSSKGQNVIIADSNTTEYCLTHLISSVEALSEAQIIEIEAGEESKSLETYQSIDEALIEQGADRYTRLEAIGGGVVSDMALFVGSTFKRGIPTYLVPTTTLAMVDASIGGKCGLNIGAVKNQIGCFAKPRSVVIDTTLLESLPERQIANGAAEMLKIACVADRELALDMLKLSPFAIGTNEELIHRCIELKQQIVRSDPYDNKERRLLNFGHTIGHAIESLALQNGADILHGEAVASGMYYAVQLSKSMPSEDRTLLCDYLSSHYQIMDINPCLSQLINYMNADKKNKNNSYRFTLLEQIGKGIYDCPLTQEEIAFYQFVSPVAKKCLGRDKKLS